MEWLSPAAAAVVGGWVVSSGGAEQHKNRLSRRRDAVTTVTSAIGALYKPLIGGMVAGAGPGQDTSAGCIFVTWGVNKKYISSITSCALRARG